jgi:DNA repair protein RecO (recombination protein O)
MPYLRDRAIVLRSDAFREHDRRLVLFGVQHGLLEAVARGASAAVSKQGGHMVPFMEVEVLVAKGVVFDKLAVARAVRSWPGIRARLGGLAVAGAFVDVFARMQRPGIVDAEAYALLVEMLQTLHSLPSDPSPDRARLLYAAAVLKLLDRVGFAPPLSACVSCREGFTQDMESLWLLPSEGAFVCPDCYRVVRRAHPLAENVSTSVLALVRFLRREPLERVLAFSGDPVLFREAASVVAILLQQAPFSKSPHGNDTILALLSDRNIQYT